MACSRCAAGRRGRAGFEAHADLAAADRLDAGRRCRSSSSPPADDAAGDAFAVGPAVAQRTSAAAQQVARRQTAANAGKPPRSKRRARPPAAPARRPRAPAPRRRRVELGEPGDAVDAPRPRAARAELMPMPITATRRGAERHGLDQDAAQLAAGAVCAASGSSAQQEVVRPLEADAQRCAGRVERLGQREADGEREAREVGALRSARRARR